MVLSKNAAGRLEKEVVQLERLTSELTCMVIFMLKKPSYFHRTENIVLRIFVDSDPLCDTNVRISPCLK